MWVALAVIVALSLTACGPPTATPSPTAVRALSCQEAERRIDGLLQEMFDVVGPRPIDFTSRTPHVPPTLVAEVDDLHRQTEDARRQFGALQLVWDRAAAASNDLQDFQRTGRGLFIEAARGELLAGRKLIDDGAVCIKK